MERLSLGDIHGRPNWKKYINEEFDEFYFLGDYFDCYDEISAVDQILNFKLICNWARSDSRVKLVLGNHDMSYLRNGDPCSGFQQYHQFDIQEVLEANMDLIKPVYLTDDILISHAGISNTFMKNINLTDPLQINDRFLQHRETLHFDKRGYNREGDDPIQGCLWIRPRSLLSDKLTGFKQIVGHTHMEQINTIDDITFIDVECRDVYRF